MFNCMFCNESFLLFEYFKCHIKLKHNDQLNSEVECNFLNCTNLYSTVYSLFRHILHIVHNTQSNKEQNRNDKGSISLNKSINNERKVHDFNLIADVASLKPMLNNKENYFLQDFNHKMLNITLRLITRLYYFDNFNRKNVHEIINNIFSSYLSESFEMLQEKYGSTSNIYNDLNIIKNSLKKFKSEHYTFKYLININCLIKPSQIKIDFFSSKKKKN